MKQKKKVLVLVILLAVFLQPSIFASEDHGRDIDIVIGEILANSQLETLSEVSVEKVSPALLEELGDVVMGLLLNDDWRHERMDAMLGGEGSSQLAAYHRDLGEQYIRAGGNLNGIYFSGGGGLIPGSMMGFSRYSLFDSRWNRLNYRSNWYWGLPVIIFIAIILLLVAVLPIIKRKRKPENQALVILKSRLARGDISQQEYKRMEKLVRN